MKEETKKPLWHLIQEMVQASFTGYRSLLMLAAILSKGNGYEAAKDHFTWYLLNSHQIPKDTTLDAQEIADIFETCVHENMKQITYACVDAMHMLNNEYGVGLSAEEDRIGFYLNAMEEQHRSLEWKLPPFIFSTVQMSKGTVTEVGCSHFGFAELVQKANPDILHYYKAVDKRKLNPKRVSRFEAKSNVRVTIETADVEEVPGILVNDDSPILLTNVLHCLHSPHALMEDLLGKGRSPVIVVVEPTPMSTLAYAFNYHMKAHNQFGMVWPATFDSFAEDFPKYGYEVTHCNNQYTAYRYIRR